VISASLAEYQADLAQLQEALTTLGKTVTPEEQRQQVIDNLVDMLLLAQGAREAGYIVDDAALQAEIDRLAGKLGSADALKTWMAQRGYDENTFRDALRRQLAAAWQRDQLAAAVPVEAEQIHARQILTTDENIANRALEQVKVPGVNFAAQAKLYDPATSGDLGWFPRGYLIQPAVEEAAFALQPGEISAVVKSEIGYHIIQVIGRETSRPLAPDARRVLQHKWIENWLAGRRANSTIEVVLP
jgi:peptidyl-prolyl cis-trans isomerase C